MRGFSSAFFLSVTLGATACSVYDTSLLKEAVGSGGQGGGGGGGGSGTGAGTSTGGAPLYCGAPDKARWPTKNDLVGKTYTDGGNIEVVTVQYTIDLGDRDSVGGSVPTEYKTIGWDLDELCTETATVTTATKCSLPSFAPGVTDGLGGIDNAMGTNIQRVHDLTGKDFSSVNYTKRLQTGAANVIIRLRDWNGEAYDNQVTADTFVAAAFDSIVKDAGAPKWDGYDVWPVAADSVNNNDVNQPKFSDENAYVVDYQIVAALPVANLRLDVGLSSTQDVKLNMKLVGSTIVCKLDPVDSGKGWEVDCNLGGIWNADDLVKQLGYFPNPVTGGPLCGGTQQYDIFKTGICQTIDMYDGLAGSTTPCNSLSFGVKWHGKQAILGDVYQANPIQNPCPDRATDPQYDSCENPGGFTGAGGSTGGGGTSSTGGRSSTGGSTSSTGGTASTGGSTSAGTGGAPSDASAD